MAINHEDYNPDLKYGAIQEETDILVAEGAILVGDSNGVASELDASGDTKILVGNATTITSVALSGDATMTNAGVVTVGSYTAATGTVATETVAATNAITAAESGTVFILSAATEFASTLPAPAAGLNYKFIIGAAPSSASYTVVTNGGANVIEGNVTVNGAAVAAVNEDTITFTDGAAAIGDWCEVVSDGTSWFVSGQAVAATAIAFTAT